MEKYNTSVDVINVTVVDNGYIVYLKEPWVFTKFQDVVIAIEKELGLTKRTVVKQPPLHPLSFRITKAYNGFILIMPNFKRVYDGFGELLGDLIEEMMNYGKKDNILPELFRGVRRFV